MIMSNPTGLIVDLCKDFNGLTTDINDVLSKDWLRTAIKSHLHVANKDIAREFTDKLVDLIYLSDHL